MEKVEQGDEGYGGVELIDRVNVDIDNDIGGFSNLEDDDKSKEKKIVSCPQTFSSPSSFCRMDWFGGEDVFSKFKRKEGRPGGGVLSSRTGTTISVQKKPRKDHLTSTNPNGSGGIKQHVRKEKLGGKIMALQQLVSPFGKSDTASVLHEALGYIKFLHDQVQILSSAYLKQLPLTHLPCDEDLKSKGLCIVPIEFAASIMGSNGADLWSPRYGKLQ